MTILGYMWSTLGDMSDEDKDYTNKSQKLGFIPQLREYLLDMDYKLSSYMVNVIMKSVNINSMKIMKNYVFAKNKIEFKELFKRYGVGKNEYNRCNLDFFTEETLYDFISLALVISCTIIK